MELPLFLKTVIVSSPQPLQPEPWLQAICQKLDCTHIVPGWYPMIPLAPGALHLTSMSPQALAAAGHTPSTVVLVRVGWP